MDWIDLAQDRNRWRVLVNAVMNLRVVVCFLLGNSPASDAGKLSRRKHIIFRTRRKFEIKNLRVP
jgi:hypothetical protein